MEFIDSKLLDKHDFFFLAGDHLNFITPHTKCFSK